MIVIEILMHENSVRWQMKCVRLICRMNETEKSFKKLKRQKMKAMKQTLANPNPKLHTLPDELCGCCRKNFITAIIVITDTHTRVCECVLAHACVRERESKRE